jgi:hypothetical protein
VRSPAPRLSVLPGPKARLDPNAIRFLGCVCGQYFIKGRPMLRVHLDAFGQDYLAVELPRRVLDQVKLVAVLVTKIWLLQHT